MGLIYRQTVLDALAEINKEVEDGDGFQYEKWREYFAEMTSPAQLQSVGDIISRHAAIDAVERAKTAMSTDGEIYCAKINAQMNIQLLPSAQPPLEEFEWCTDCKEYDQKAHCCHRYTKVIRKTMEELKVVRCKDCKWFGDIGCAIKIVDDSDRPSEYDFCSFAERKDNG